MKNLRIIREKKKITQVNLSTDVDVTQETISAYENGKTLPSVDVLLKLANKFGTSTDYLLDRTNISTPVDEIVNKDLRTEELELISEFRELSIEQQNRVLGFISGMLK